MPFDANTPEFSVPGPSDQQPNAPLSDAVGTLHQVGQNVAEVAKAIKGAMDKFPSVQNEITKGFQNMALELETNLDHITDIHDALKTVSATAKSFQKGVFNTKNFKYAAEALEEMSKAQEKIKTLAGKGTKEYQEALRVQIKIKEYTDKYRDSMKATGKAAEMQKEHLKELSDLMHNLVGSTGKFATSWKNVSINHVTRQIHGMSKALAELGVGRGFSQKMDKYTAGAEIKARVQEMKRDRTAGNIAAAKQKRDAIMDSIRSNPTPYGLTLKNGELDMSAHSSHRRKIAEQMGLGRRATGMFAKGDDDAAFQHGTGGALSRGLSKAAGMAETGVGGIAGFAAQIAPVLAVLEVLREGFDKVVEQNKSMESGLGKSGLFAQPGTTGFMEARRNLTPDTAYTKLGLNFDRNLKIAQALQEGGRGLQELVTGKGGRPAGQEFGPGGFGQFQKIAVGAGRVAGLTDTEGIQQTLKLLDEYSQTLEVSEDFFIKVTKGANAAGLSTTKYIGLIDEVNSHFSRMNKSLDTTLNMLTELSKTGRIGAEDLKQYMDFLTAGGPAKGMGDVALNAYAMMNESPGRRRARMEDAQYTLNQAVSTAQGAGFELTPEQVKGLSGPNAQSIIQRLDLQLAHNTDLSPDQKQNREAALTQLKRQAAKFAGIKMGGGAISQAFGQTFGQTPEEVAMRNQDLLEQAVRASGGSMEQFMREGPRKFGASHQAFAGALETFKLSPELAQKAFEGRGQTASTMLSQAQGLTGLGGSERDQMRLNAREFLKEFQRKYKGKLPVSLDDKAIDALSDTDLQGTFQKNSDMFSDVAAGMNATSSFLRRSMLMDQKVTPADRAEAMHQARMVGLQTQTTGEMIASAFSKWFNNIIGYLGKISDFLLRTSPEDKKFAASSYTNPENVRLQQQAEQKATDAKLMAMQEYDAAVKADDQKGMLAASIKMDAAAKSLEKLQDTSSENRDDVNKWLDLIGGKSAPTAQNTADLLAAGYSGDEDGGTVYDTLSKLPGMTGGGGDNVTMSRDALMKNMDMLRPLIQSGALQATGGADKQGNITFHITNNYSAEITQTPAGHNSVVGANSEHPTAQAQSQAKKKN